MARYLVRENSSYKNRSSRRHTASRFLRRKRDDDIYETAKLSITYSKVKTGMPGNVSEKLIRQCTAPTLVMAAEKDCLFPAKRVIPRAEKIFADCTTYLLENRGHMNFLTDDEKQMIVDFLKE